MDTTPVIMESQADWLSAVGPLGEPGAATVHTLEELIDRERAAGMARHPFSLHGYHGVRCGRAAYALGPDQLLMQLSGQLAEEQLELVERLNLRCTRLDLAVTVRFTPPSNVVADEAYGRHTEWAAARSRAPKSSLVRSSTGGATCYIGKRGAYRLGRLYNKEAERRDSRDPAGERRYSGAWRWELESSGDLATRTLVGYRAAPDRVAYCASVVRGAFSDWGAEPPWGDATRVSIVPGFSRRSDRDRQLNWLQANVLPVIKGLRAAGYGSQVDRILNGSDQGATHGSD